MFDAGLELGGVNDVQAREVVVLQMQDQPQVVKWAIEQN